MYKAVLVVLALALFTAVGAGAAKSGKSAVQVHSSKMKQILDEAK